MLDHVISAVSDFSGMGEYGGNTLAEAGITLDTVKVRLHIQHGWGGGRKGETDQDY